MNDEIHLGFVPDPIGPANALVDAGDPLGAVRLLQSQLERGRGSLQIRLALGRAWSAAGRRDQAIEILHEAASLAPDIAEAALAFGEALLAAAQLPSAIAELQRALRLDPRLDAAQYALGRAWLEAGEIERAKEIFSRLAGDDSAFAKLASEKLSEADALGQADRSPPGYVRHLFDQFSASYDTHMLGELSYRAHTILRGLADMIVGAAPGSLDILDLGCGTGLAGSVFKDLARRMDGVDLSPRMVEQAKARGIYDALLVGDVESVLSQLDESYDLIIAADTIVYLGDLGPLLDGVKARLRNGGFFLFTAEKADGEFYALGPKRRYRHSESYLRQASERAGLEIMGFLECSPRDENRLPVEGFVIGLRSTVEQNRSK